VPNEVPTCTIAAFPLTLLGVTGFVTSIFALVLLIMPSRHARMAAAVATIVGIFTLAFGVVARDRMDQAVEAARGKVDEAAIAFGHAGAKTCATTGFQEGMMPLTAGIVVFVVSAIRRAKGTERFEDDDRAI
jgi:uncharacterized membrane protein